MTPKQIQLVQNSWKQVVPISDKAAELFYGRLFQLEPSYRRLFTSDQQEQGRKLMQMITVAVNGLPKLDTIVPAVEDLGRRHLDYNVTEEMYDTVGEALLWTLKQGLGPAFASDIPHSGSRNSSRIFPIMASAALAAV